jgi:hypothetical protein
LWIGQVAGNSEALQLCICFLALLLSSGVLLFDASNFVVNGSHRQAASSKNNSHLNSRIAEHACNGGKMERGKEAKDIQGCWLDSLPQLQIFSEITNGQGLSLFGLLSPPFRSVLPWLISSFTRQSNEVWFFIPIPPAVAECSSYSQVRN